MNIRIREACEADIENLVELNHQVQQLHVELAPDLYRETENAAVSEWFKKQIQEKGNFVLVAEINNRLLGYILVRMISRPAHIFCHDRSCAYIDQICVDTKHRRKGIALKLISEAIQRTNRAGMTRLELDVRSDNKSAKSSFEAMGFNTYGEKMIMDVSGNGKP